MKYDTLLYKTMKYDTLTKTGSSVRGLLSALAILIGSLTPNTITVM